MKRIKHFVLGVAGAVLITAGLFSCSNEETNNPQQEKSETVMTTTSSTEEEFERKAIATISGDVAVPLYDEVVLKNALVAQGAFAEVESIELTYFFNTDESEYQAFLTIIGKNVGDFLLGAFVADLVIDEGEVFIMNPQTASALFMNHTCTGVNCSSCEFKRDWTTKITGCKPCPSGDVIEEGQAAGCSHSKTTGSGAIAHIVHVIVESY